MNPKTSPFFPDRVLADIDCEAVRASKAHPNLGMLNGTGDDPMRSFANAFRQACRDAAKRGFCTWQDVLLEEVYEALSERGGKKLRAELVQVAAVCVRWIRRIDGGQS